MVAASASASASASGHGAVWEDREYELTVRQEPKQARMCGVGTKGVCFFDFCFFAFAFFVFGWWGCVCVCGFWS